MSKLLFFVIKDERKCKNSPFVTTIMFSVSPISRSRSFAVLSTAMVIFTAIIATFIWNWGLRGFFEFFFWIQEKMNIGKIREWIKFGLRVSTWDNFENDHKTNLEMLCRNLLQLTRLFHGVLDVHGFGTVDKSLSLISPFCDVFHVISIYQTFHGGCRISPQCLGVYLAATLWESCNVHRLPLLTV